MTDTRHMSEHQAEAIRLAAMDEHTADAYRRAKTKRYDEQAADNRRRQKLAERLEALRAEADELEGM